MKLSVYVRDDLADRLRVVKDEINVSEICQASLAKAVSAAEVARLGDLRPRIVERLKRTRTPEEQQYDQGMAYGRMWAADAATLADLKAVAMSAHGDMTLGGAVARVQIWHQRAASTSLGRPTGVLDAALGAIAAVGLAHQAVQPGYLEGFRAGVEEVWESVREELGQ